MSTWKRRELWHRRGDGFRVEVSHHTVELDGNKGPNRWCVYVYIYPAHPHYSEFCGENMWQGAATALPLHGGPTMLRWHRDANGNPTSVQVGADYDHCGDAEYTYYENAFDAAEVFDNADELVAWMEARTGQECEYMMREGQL